MIVSALLLADNVYQDVRTGKHIVAGTFSLMGTEGLPGHFPHTVHLFMSCYGQAGLCRWVLRFLAPSGQELAKRPMELEVEDAEEQVELILEVPRLPLPEEGRYQFLLEDENGEVLAQTSFRLLILPRP